MPLSGISYTSNARAANLNVYTVAEADAEGNIRTEVVTPNNPTFNCYSIAKAFSVLAVGICRDRGLLRVEDTVANLLGKEMPPEYYEKWSRVTLDQLMRHRAGYGQGCLDIDAEDAAGWGSDDYLALALSAPLPYPPGERYQYTDAAYYLVSRIVSAVTGMTLADFLRPVLFGVMGFSEFGASVCPKGYTMGATGFYLRTKDLVKLGVLWLRDGDWQGTRVVSREWCETVRENGYEYSARSADGKWCGKGGMRGQMLAVNRDLGRAVAWNAYGKVPFEEMIRDTIPE